MLAVLMFHQVYHPNKPENLEKLQQFFAYLSKHHPIVLPGDPLSKHKLSFCITFDDAYYDFYHYVFPLLKQTNLTAVLGVPVKYIQNDTTQSSSTRLSLPHGTEMDDAYPTTHTPFCTWTELKEMADSNIVAMASHSFNHCNVTEANVDLQFELQNSKQTLEQRLQKSIDTFIYPYGKYSAAVNKEVARYYPYQMRIGSALNKNWHNQQNVIYRINADPFWQNDLHWKMQDTVKYYLKYLSNLLRGK